MQGGIQSGMSAHGVPDNDEQFDIGPAFIEQKHVEKTKQADLMNLPNKFTATREINCKTPIQSLEYLGDDAYLAVGCDDGCTRIVSTLRWDFPFTLRSEDQSPVTSLSANKQATMRNTIMLTHSDGTLEYWHATSEQLLFKRSYQDILQCCEISPNGNFYAFSKNDGTILLGNLSKGEPLQIDVGNLGGHTNRIFCLKWSPYDENLMVSGGWDKAVHFWDVRKRSSIKTLFGCYMGGEAIDFRPNEILLGSNSHNLQLRIYDEKADKLRSVEWPITSDVQRKFTTGVLACSFSPSKQNIVSMSAKGQLRLHQGEKCRSEWVNEKDAKIYSMSVCSLTQTLATGWSDGQLIFFEY